MPKLNAAQPRLIAPPAPSIHTSGAVATALRCAGRLAASIASVGSLINYDAFSARLIGKTVRPEAAEKTMANVRFDGHGRIEGFRGLLAARDYHILANNLTTALSEVPARQDNPMARTPAEALINIAALVNEADIATSEKQAQAQRIKDTYLSGKVSRQTLVDLREILSYRVADSAFLDKVDAVVKSVEKEFYVTRHADNYYGRLFDSEISRHIVQHPSADMLKALQYVTDSIVRDFESYTPDSTNRETLCTALAETLRKDNPPWRAGIAEVDQFMAEPTPDKFLCLLECRNPCAHLVVAHLAVKYLLHAPGFAALTKEASSLYRRVICAQRNLNRVMNSQELSQRYGVLLHYQYGGTELPEGKTGTRPMDRYKLSTRSVTAHDQYALEHERAIGIGMSGSSNLFNHLFLELERQHPDFPAAAARLIAAAYLTYSGGHSINEAYTVFGYRSSGSFKPMSFDVLYEQSDVARDAIDGAYDKLVGRARELNGGG